MLFDAALNYHRVTDLECIRILAALVPFGWLQQDMFQRSDHIFDVLRDHK